MLAAEKKKKKKKNPDRNNHRSSNGFHYKYNSKPLKTLPLPLYYHYLNGIH